MHIHKYLYNIVKQGLLLIISAKEVDSFAPQTWVAQVCKTLGLVWAITYKNDQDHGFKYEKKITLKKYVKCNIRDTYNIGISCRL